MHWQRTEPESWPQTAGVTLLEAEPGAARDAVVARWCTQRVAGAATWHVRCNAREHGPWSGLDTLVEQLAVVLRDHAPDLLARHASELCLVVPSLTAELTFPRSLTDIVDGDEKTRNYAADRAYRALHGIIDLLADWHARLDAKPWSIVCDGLDDGGAMVRRFFAELVRRRGERLGLQLLVVTAPGRGDEVAGTLGDAAITAAVRLDLPREERERPSPEAMAVRAAELEREIEDAASDPLPAVPRLIEAWRASTSPERALSWQLTVMERYNHMGLYEASLPYAEDVRGQLERVAVEDPELYYRGVNALYFCWVPLGQPDAARIVMETLLERVESAAEVSRYCYLLSMLHARFLEPTDQVRAEAYLQRALDVLSDADVPNGERHFLSVFAMNGLALVRLRQGRIDEALELCRAGVARLDRHLAADRHRLHRSVLLFNIAQVHAQIGPYEVALEYFGRAMAMDPNYSEYYNDRGGVYLKLGRFEAAERDFLRAIELSPPYAEVWTNLGQCWRAMSRMRAAERAYTRALDLEPDCALALTGRADARLALDDAALALADYDRSLELEPDQALVLASRAIVHYDAGRVHDAVADLDAAIALAPDVAELYFNRATALRDIGRQAEAERDMSAYRELAPEDEDRGEVEIAGAGR